jgi:hypothetical protein
VLADIEGVDPDRFCKDSLLDRIPDHLSAVDGKSGVVNCHRNECVEAEFERRSQFRPSQQLLDCSNVWMAVAIPRCPAFRRPTLMVGPWRGREADLADDLAVEMQRVLRGSPIGKV